MSERKPINRAGMLLVGRYEVGILIGVGATGSVWTAKHLVLKSEVVVKFHETVLDNAKEEVTLARFLREAKLLAGINHVNVVAHHASGKTKAGEPFLIMDRLHGQTLATSVRSGAAPTACS